MAKRALFSCAITVVATSLLAGCGGVGQLAGVNSDVFFGVESTTSSDFVLVVVPNRGAYDSTAGCRTDAVGTNPAWCSVNDPDDIEFTTVSGASESPYYAYIRNVGAGSMRCRVYLRMKERGTIRHEDRYTIDVARGEVVRVYEIFRNNYSRTSS
ncbi:MAG: hypothetical protein KIS66_12685 [Fimbriimonadaceae bacterium]|nr:hypothetical protein [Fimbriimonadaceae bacterium]